MKFRPSFVLVSLFCVLLSAIPRDVAAAEIGESGVKGADGDTPSGNGEAGTAGDDANDVLLNGDAQNFALAIGGSGGDGGKGGNGMVVPIFSPQGGSGGPAGNAGHANAAAGGVKSVVGAVDVTATAVGGDGGFGGFGGTGEPGGSDGAGGDAGDAAAVGRVARSGEGPTILTVNAEGGRGGDSGGRAASGFGGDADVFAELTSTAAGKQTVSLVSIGGAGSGSSIPGGPGRATAASSIDVVGELSLNVNVVGGERGFTPNPPTDTNAGSAAYEGAITTKSGPITARYKLEGYSTSLIDAATAGDNLDVLGTLTSMTGSNTDKSPGGGAGAQAVYKAAGNAKIDFTLLGGGGGGHFDPDTNRLEQGPGGPSGMNLTVDAGGQINAGVSVLGGTGIGGGVGSVAGNFNSVGRAAVSAAAIGGNSNRGSGANANVGIRVESASTASGQVQSRGGVGGDGQGGTASSSLIVTAPGLVSASGSATGGLSGSSSPGGAANLSILGISTAGGEVQASGQAVGGSGGGSVDTNGAQGGDVSLFNAVRGDTTGQMRLGQSAYGGPGGFSATGAPGFGGNAVSEISVLETSSTLATLAAIAIGGPGGPAVQSSGAAGGIATAINQGKNEHGRMLVNAESVGGLGGISTSGSGGQGGPAIALARGAAVGNGQNIEITSRATGGDGNSGANDSRFGFGGNASSEALGSSTGGGSYFISAFSNGGTGLTGGNAQSVAKGIAESTGVNLVNATASGGSPKFAGGFGGNAFAEATAERLITTGVSIATATAKAGNAGLAFARATAIGPGGEASATSNTPGMSAIAVAPVGSTTIVETQTGFNVPAPAPTTPGLTSYVYLTANPLKADVLRALADNPTAHEDFDVGGASQMLAMVSMGSSYPLDGNGALKTMGTTFTQTLDLTGVAVLQDLMVALVNPELTGSFISLRFSLAFGGTPLINQTFTDADTMNAFFGDRSLNLVALSPEAQGRTLSVSFDFASRTPGSGFSTQLAFGNSSKGIGPTVPEPNTLLLASLTLLLPAGKRCAAQRRRR